MQIAIIAPDGFEEEKRYACDFVCDYLFGSTPTLVFSAAAHDYEISLADRRVSFPDVYFSSGFLSSFQSPQTDRRLIRDVARTWTCPLYVPFATFEGNGDTLGFDLFGAVYYFLSLIGERSVPPSDRHNRKTWGSLPAIHKELIRVPTLNFLLEVTRTFLRRKIGALPDKKRTFSVRITHDMDYPLSTSFGTRVLLGHVSNGIRKGEVRSAVGFMRDILKRGLPFLDLGDSFSNVNWIMDQSERFGFTSEFNFFSRSWPDERNYSLADPSLAPVLRSILDRKHEIGIHGSYTSFGDAQRLSSEVHAFRQVVERMGGPLKRVIGRQHYLRFVAPETWRAQEEAGIDVDSTLAFADSTAFRAGFANSYNPFDFERRVRFKVRETPLTVMETTLLEKEYMSLNHRAALAEIDRIADLVCRVCGEFILLWHNSSLLYNDQRACYVNVLEALSKKRASCEQTEFEWA
jgi:hypothetical protein